MQVPELVHEARSYSKGMKDVAQHNQPSCMYFLLQNENDKYKCPLNGQLKHGSVYLGQADHIQPYFAGGNKLILDFLFKSKTFCIVPEVRFCSLTFGFLFRYLYFYFAS